MTRKRPDRPERTARRAAERSARDLVRDRERLAAMLPGGTAGHPIQVATAAVIEPRVAAMTCPQCAGEYALREHRSAGPGLRELAVRCRQCGATRSLWFRIVERAPN